MAEFHFLKGTFKGRLGDVVFSSWKGIDYAKQYTKPGNPRTPRQVAHRGVWGALAHIGSGLNQDILDPYTFPRPQKQTAYNTFISINHAMLSANLFNPQSLKIFDGPLPGVAINTVTYSAPTHYIEVKWTINTAANLRAIDKYVLAFVQGLDVVGYEVGTGTYDEGGIDVLSFPKITQGPMFVYLAFVRVPTPGTDEQGSVSTTAFKQFLMPQFRAGDTPADAAAPDAPESASDEKQGAKA